MEYTIRGSALRLALIKCDIYALRTISVPVGYCFQAPENGGCRRIGKTTTGAYMTSQNLFEEIDRKMKEILTRGPAADLEKNLRALLASAFGRLDLVTREEFDVQREVLARTRARLEELEAKLAELEGRNKVQGTRHKG